MQDCPLDTTIFIGRGTGQVRRDPDRLGLLTRRGLVSLHRQVPHRGASHHNPTGWFLMRIIQGTVSFGQQRLGQLDIAADHRPELQRLSLRLRCITS